MVGSRVSPGRATNRFTQTTGANVPIVLANIDDVTGELTTPPLDKPAAVAVIVADLLPKLRFSDLNRLRLDIIPRVLRQKAKELSAAQGLDIVTAMRAAGMEPPDDDGAAGAPVIVPPDGTDPTSGLPTVVPIPMPQEDDGELEDTVLYDRPNQPEGSAEACGTIQ